MSTLSDMVDLAIGTPEPGCVNYTVLHSLLHGILAQLQISESPMHINVITPRIEKHGVGSAKGTASSASGGRSRDASVRSSDSELELKFHDDPSPGERKEGESGGGGSSSGGGGERSDSKKREGSGGSSSGGGGGKGANIKKIKVGRRTEGHGIEDGRAMMVQSVPFHELVRKVERLETAWEELNEIPRMESFKVIEDDEKADGETEVEARGGGPGVPLKDAWDYLQMHKQVDANKEGVDKVSKIYRLLA